MSLGSEIRLLRSNLGMRQNELAAIAGISPQYLNDIEQGSRRPDDEHLLERIASALDVPTEYLLYLVNRLPDRTPQGAPIEQVKRAYDLFLSTLAESR